VQRTWGGITDEEEMLQRAWVASQCQHDLTLTGDDRQVSAIARHR
jgi:hypothetical protein